MSATKRFDAGDALIETKNIGAPTLPDGVLNTDTVSVLLRKAVEIRYCRVPRWLLPVPCVAAAATIRCTTHRPFLQPARFRPLLM
jgi:hypothetical protein